MLYSEKLSGINAHQLNQVEIKELWSNNVFV